MTNRTTEMAKDQLAADIGAVIADAEELLHATASQAGDKAVAARTRIQASLKAARKQMTDLEMAAMDNARAAARATDDYVHDHPWTAIGIAAAAGAVVGILISRR